MARLYVKIKDQDNVVVAVQDLKAGTEIMEGLVTNQDIPQAHKIALCDIPAGGEIIRYGVVLGYAINDIKKGDWINEHMLDLPQSPSAPKSYPRRNILPVCCHVYSLHADSLETGAGDHRKIIGRD